MRALFVKPEDFKEGDIVFPSSMQVAYKLEKITDETFALVEFSPNSTDTKKFEVKKSYFLSFFVYTVCRKV